MTPFGRRMRELRAARGITLKRMAEALMVSPAYLSALEHGHRGRPTPGLIHQVCEYFDIIWDDAEELKALAARSHPRVVLDTSGLSPAHTAFANLLATHIRDLPEPVVEAMTDLVRNRDGNERA